MSIATALNWAGAILVIQVSPIIVHLHYGKQSLFWTFAGFSLIGGIICWLFLPETKGKSFAQIRQLFHTKHTTDDNKESELIQKL